MEKIKSWMKWLYLQNLYGIDEDLEGENLENEEEDLVQFPIEKETW